MSKAEHTCEKRVFTNHHRGLCGRGARYEHEGRWYCKTHHPPTIEAKNKARLEKWKCKWAAKNKARERDKNINTRRDELEALAIEHKDEFWAPGEDPLRIKLSDIGRQLAELREGE